MEKRGGALIDIELDRLEKRMRAYLDKGLPWHAYEAGLYDGRLLPPKHVGPEPPVYLLLVWF
jgi:hypothetical protein